MSYPTLDTQTSVPTQRTGEAGGSGPTAPAGWVPVERRWLGFDRSTVAPSLVVLALALVMFMVVPRVNDAIPYNDRVRSGDVLALDGGVTFEPPPGWGITNGVREAEPGETTRTTPTATIVKGDLQVSITSAAFDGDSKALLDQIEKTDQALNDNGPSAIGKVAELSTTSGLDGVASRYRGVSSDGLIAAFAADGRGIKFVATGAPGAAQDNVDDLAQILASIERKAS